MDKEALGIICFSRELVNCSSERIFDTGIARQQRVNRRHVVSPLGTFCTNDSGSWNAWRAGDDRLTSILGIVFSALLFLCFVWVAHIGTVSKQHRPKETTVKTMTRNGNTMLVGSWRTTHTNEVNNGWKSETRFNFYLWQALSSPVNEPKMNNFSLRHYFWPNATGIYFSCTSESDSREENRSGTSSSNIKGWVRGLPHLVGGNYLFYNDGVDKRGLRLSLSPSLIKQTRRNRRSG